MMNLKMLEKLSLGWDPEGGRGGHFIGKRNHSKSARPRGNDKKSKVRVKSKRCQGTKTGDKLSY